MGFSREEPILAAGEKLRPVLRDYRESTKKQQVCATLFLAIFANPTIAQQERIFHFKERDHGRSMCENGPRRRFDKGRCNHNY